jgi:hypothetical protein
MISFIYKNIKNAPVYKFRYAGDKMHTNEKTIFVNEAQKPNAFDQLKSIRTHHSLLNEGAVKPFIIENPFMRICILDSENRGKDIFKEHAEIWSRITGAFYGANSQSNSRRNAGGTTNKTTVFLCCNRQPKKIPTDDSALSPFHINGGYTYPCSKRMIMIYRLEECDRVLIHELLHSFCTDNEKDSTEVKEAKTEAWAELFWCCFIAIIHRENVWKVLGRQTGWIIAQNRRIIELVGESNATYGRRYTLLKEQVWKRLCPLALVSTGDIAEGMKLFSRSDNSLSFTFRA